jgi:hypothetical protein
MKSLACIFGRHRWTPHVEHGDEYNVCSRCGKLSDPPTLDAYVAAQQADEQLAKQDGGGYGGSLKIGDRRTPH